MIEYHDGRLEPGVAEPRRPLRAREQPFEVPIAFRADRTVVGAQQIRVVDDVRRVRWIRIPGPLQIPQTAAASVVPAVIGRGLKRLAQMIWSEERRSTW